MGRLEKYGNGEQIRQRLHRTAGLFETLNIDMIFNFPDQSEASLTADLDILIEDVEPDQVSFYPLMLTDSTLRPVQKRLGDVDHKREKALYRLITKRMLAGGYQRSSAWCFSRQTNMIDEYITTQDEYLGLGSGAFSYIGGHFYASTFSLNHYVDRVRAGQIGIVRERAMSMRDQMRYYLLTRLFSGTLELDAADERFAGQFRRSLGPELFGLRFIGAVKRYKGRLQLTERGFYLWVVLMREFFSGVNNFREEMRHNIPSERPFGGTRLRKTADN
jgi:coproporphyrinogen III oxidase-like Fe-S oxidoreductase